MHAIIPFQAMIQLLDDPRSSCGIEEFLDGRLCSVFSLSFSDKVSGGGL